MGQHKVVQGDCVSSIAETNGFFWETLWNLPENTQLKELRKDPNILLPGDLLYVPDKRPKEVSEPTNQVHKFRVKNVPAKVKIRILRDAEPRVGEKYVLMIDGVEKKRGAIPSDGYVEVPIIPIASEGKLVIGDDDDQEEYVLQLGYLDPIDTVTGVKARLNNIGFDCGKINNELDQVTIEAISNFQGYIRHPKPTGQVDDLTRNALEKLHDEMASS
jgi:hypothetical protein